MNLVGTLLSMNEFTSSVSSSVNAFILESGDELFRSLSIGSNWTRARLSFRYTLVGTPSTGNITGFRFFAGFCAGYNKRLDQPNDHCAGLMLGSFTDGNPTTLTAVTHDSASVPGETVCFSNASYFVGREQNGAFSGGSGKSVAVMPRYETQWSSSLSYYRLMGYPWVDACTSVVRDDNLTGSISWVAFGGTQYPFNNNLAQYAVSKPRGVYRMAVEALDDGGGGAGSGALSYGQAAINFLIDEGILGQSYEGNVLNGVGFDEQTYGYFDSVNFKFQCTTSGVKLAIRDVVVTLLDP